MPKFKVNVRHWLYEDETVLVEADNEDAAASIAKERSSPKSEGEHLEYSDTSLETMTDEAGEETHFI